ncbi:ABC transporter substrate-binding protein [Rhizobium sp. RM]|uniref:ABC transporter substrate-binding protein n=1 Tax=Rhizobium sp. RM TaxID=2748079 RepID=UPI00110F5769|nr:ABC transporter substrate-binding protein [Rhizobium sp. RM]NWJ27684.1 ABC transporter substrate-binding protein [Rhizobium sp. RM]TMV21850.1 ABC transporter substrate-binding protein [Rhizobium sp. Td3]
MSRTKLAIYALSAALAAGTATAADKVVFQLDWLPGGDKAPIYVCVQEGFCSEAGIEVEIASGRGSTDAISRLAAASSDIGVSDIGALMAARANEGVKVTAVMSLFNKGPHAFYVAKGGSIASVADVKGKTIATSPFTSSNVYLPLVLKDAGIDMADIKLVKADPGALGPMLMTGNADGIIAWMTDLTRYSSQGKEAGKDIIALPWSSAGLELYSASLIASDDFLAKRPQVAARFVAAYRKSVEFSRLNPQKAAAAVTAMVAELGAEDVEGSLKDALPLIFNEVTEKDGLGVFDKARLAETWRRVSQAQAIDPAKLDPETIVNRTFAVTE